MYSFKFSFRRTTDALGEIAASSKGEEYVLTYYKKLREERAEYYGKRYRKHSHLR